MRVIKSDNAEIPIRASNLTHVFFRQEFGTELSVEIDRIKTYFDSKATLEDMPLDADRIQDIYKIQNLNSMPAKEAHELLSRNADLIKPLLNLAANQNGMSIPMDSIMRVVWSMNRAQDFADNKSTTSPYNEWIVRYDGFDFESNLDCIYEEIKRGFFRSENK